MFYLMVSNTELWLPIIVIGVALLVIGWFYAKFARKSWGWSVADAAVSRMSKLDLGTRRSIDPSRFDTPLAIHLEYTYSVRGEQWKNEYIARWRKTGRREILEATEFQEKNPVGKRFQILYNPDNPFDSLLNGPRNPLVGLLTGTIGAALLVFALVNWVFSPVAAVQLAVAIIGIVACGAIIAVTDYPFERPWWFEKSEDEAADFMLSARVVKQPERFRV